MSVATHMLLLPMESDILEGDIITGVTNRRGKSLVDFRLRVTAVAHRETHVEAGVELYS